MFASALKGTSAAVLFFVMFVSSLEPRLRDGDEALLAVAGAEEKLRHLGGPVCVHASARHACRYFAAHDFLVSVLKMFISAVG